MNPIPAQEIKRRGIAAVAGLIATGDVHIFDFLSGTSYKDN